MRETYWDQFMATGSIEDYLNYKMKAEQSGGGAGLKEKQSAAGTGSSRESAGIRQKEMSAAGNTDSDGRKEQCESNRTYRDGAFHSAGW